MPAEAMEAHLRSHAALAPPAPLAASLIRRRRA
jgi:hypothetical protein